MQWNIISLQVGLLLLLCCKPTVFEFLAFILRWTRSWTIKKFNLQISLHFEFLLRNKYPTRSFLHLGPHMNLLNCCPYEILKYLFSLILNNVKISSQYVRSIFNNHGTSIWFGQYIEGSFNWRETEGVHIPFRCRRGQKFIFIYVPESIMVDVILFDVDNQFIIFACININTLKWPIYGCF